MGLRGGAYQGREVAGVILTNGSPTTCTVQGYATAQLQRRGLALGAQATHAPGTAKLITLRTGQSAAVALTAVSTCQAPESDHVALVLPGDTTPLTAAIQLRGCGLTVAPFALG